MTIVCATNEGLHARCKTYHSNTIKFEFIAENGDIKAFDTDLEIDNLLKVASKGDFFSYVAGTAAAVLKVINPSLINRFHQIRSFLSAIFQRESVILLTSDDTCFLLL